MACEEDFPNGAREKSEVLAVVEGDLHFGICIKCHTHLIWGARKIRLKNVVTLATENGRVVVPHAR